MIENLLDIQLLDIVSLSSSEPRSKFSKEEIDDLANNYLEAGGNVKPILVQRIDLENFEIIFGHLEYYAAVRAREINDDFELIRGIVTKKDNQALFQQQYNLYNSTETNSVSTTVSGVGIDSQAIATLEKNLSAHLQDQLKFEISRLQFDLLANLDKKFCEVKSLVPCDQDHLDFFNNGTYPELVAKLQSAGIKGKKGTGAALAIEQERKKGQFTSFFNLTERVRLKNKKKTRAVTEKTMVKILDAWNRFVDIKQL
ncbi:MAG: hypothetical protein WBB82_05865 [Limnothrix sp.]